MDIIKRTSDQSYCEGLFLTVKCEENKPNWLKVINKCILGGTESYVVAVFVDECTPSELEASVDEYLSTPLHYAVLQNDSDMVKMLLEHKVSPNVQSSGGKSTPLHIAAKMGIFKICVDLFSSGADPTIVDAGGNTPMWHAVEGGDESIMRMMVRNVPISMRKHAVNMKNLDGNTPLHHAVGLDLATMTKVLLSLGADPLVENNKKITPLAMSQSNQKNPKVAKAFKYGY